MTVIKDRKFHTPSEDNEKDYRYVWASHANLKNGNVSISEPILELDTQANLSLVGAHMGFALTSPYRALMGLDSCPYRTYAGFNWTSPYRAHTLDLVPGSPIPTKQTEEVCVFPFSGQCGY